MKKLKVFITTTIAVSMPQLMFAAAPKCTPPCLKTYGGGSLGTFLNVLKDWLLGFAGAAAVLFIVIGGIKYMTAAGDEKKVSSAKATLTYAIMGLVLVLLSRVILSLIAGDLVGTIFGNTGLPF